jgi:hypothetical protein
MSLAKASPLSAKITICFASLSASLDDNVCGSPQKTLPCYGSYSPSWLIRPQTLSSRMHPLSKAVPNSTTAKPNYVGTRQNHNVVTRFTSPVRQIAKQCRRAGSMHCVFRLSCNAATGCNRLANNANYLTFTVQKIGASLTLVFCNGKVFSDNNSLDLALGNYLFFEPF